MKYKIDAEKLLECIGHVGDDLVAESETAVPAASHSNQRRRFSWMSAAAVFVLALVIAGTYYLSPAMRRGGANDMALEYLAPTGQAGGMPPPQAAAPLPDASSDTAPGTVPESDDGDGFEPPVVTDAVPPSAVAGNESADDMWSAVPAAPAPAPETAPETAPADSDRFGELFNVETRAFHASGLHYLSVQDLVYPYYEGSRVVLAREVGRREESDSIRPATWAETMPVYLRTPSYDSGERLVPMDSPSADEILAQIASFSVELGLRIEDADEVTIHDYPFYICFCCRTFSRIGPLAVMPVEVDVRWGDTGISYYVGNGQWIYMYDLTEQDPLERIPRPWRPTVQVLWHKPGDADSILIGHYPVYTPQEAQQRLLDGHYLSTVYSDYPPTEERIVHVELVYIIVRQRVFMPVYLFYTELPPDHYMLEREAAELHYGVYHVFAVRSEYFIDDTGR